MLPKNPRITSDDPTLQTFVDYLNTVGERGNACGPVMGNRGLSTTTLPGGGMSIVDHGITPTFKILHCIIKDTGPLGTEDDYTDARYWVKEIYYKQTDAHTPTTEADPEEEDDTDKKVFTATNVPETVNDTHNLKVGDFVWVLQVSGRNTTGKTFVDYVFFPSGRTGFFPVIVKGNGGSDGSSSAFASYTYDLYDLSDTGYVTKKNLSGAIGPEHCYTRGWKMNVTKAADGSVGEAYYDDDGVIVLRDCNEVPTSQSNCS